MSVGRESLDHLSKGNLRKGTMYNVNPSLLRTRRHFFKDCAVGVGAMALASLFQSESQGEESPLSARAPHHPPRARNVIFLFMAGGPSQLETFDWKPKLQDLHGQPIPDSFMKDKRFAFMDTFAKEVP